MNISGFTVEECGAAGDCWFWVLSVALSRLTHQNISMMQIRKDIALTVNENNLHLFCDKVLRHYEIFKNIVKPPNVDVVQKIIQTKGFDFIGTDELMQWQVDTHLQKYGMGVVFYSQFGIDLPTIIENPTTTFYLLVFNKNNVHWQLLKYNGFCFVDKQTYKEMFLQSHCLQSHMTKQLAKNNSHNS